jgi:predicted dehydrogenase
VGFHRVSVTKDRKKAYANIEKGASQAMTAPELPYQPPRPRRYNPPIGLIGCGGISATHLGAYKQMGLNIVALCDLIEERAENRRKEFFPKAQTYTDYKQLLKRSDIEVVDIATHPLDREYLIPAAINAGKHVLSQKPFVLNLDKGEKFAALAEKKGVTLAVNQNGRWAPHFSYFRQAINKGLIGDVYAAHLGCHWDHEWIQTTHFNRVHHIVLYDYAIHWFDMLNCIMRGKPAKRVFSTLRPASHQSSRPPLLGQCVIEYDDAQASLRFDAAVKIGPQDTAYVAGTKGTLRYEGPSLTEHTVTITTAKGTGSPKLQGQWFREGFMGSMGELLSAIEKKRMPVNNPIDNLQGLAICFAAVVSAESGKPETVGRVRKVPLKTCQVAPK